MKRFLIIISVLLVFFIAAGCTAKESKISFENSGLMDGTFIKDSIEDAHIIGATHSYELVLNGKTATYTETTEYSYSNAKIYTYLTGEAVENPDKSVTVTFSKLEMLAEFDRSSEFEEEYKTKLDEAQKSYESGEISQDEYNLTKAYYTGERTEISMESYLAYKYIKVQTDASQMKFLLLESLKATGDKTTCSYYVDGTMMYSETTNGDKYLEILRFEENGNRYEGLFEIEDENGRLSEVQEYMAGTLVTKRIYSYDTNGNLVKESFVRPEYKLIDEDTYSQYYTFGEYRRAEYTYKNGVIFTESGFRTDNIPEYYCEYYTEFGEKLVRIYLYYDENGDLVSTEEYTYYDSGNIKTYREAITGYDMNSELFAEYADKKDTFERTEKRYDFLGDGTKYVWSEISFDEYDRIVNGKMYFPQGVVMGVYESQTQSDGTYLVVLKDVLHGNRIEEELIYDANHEIIVERSYRYSGNALSWWSETTYLDDECITRYFLADGTEVGEDEVPD